jgi:hypothetical protein
LALPVTNVFRLIPYATPQQQAIAGRITRLSNEIARINLTGRVESAGAPANTRRTTEDAGPGDSVDIRA